MSGPCSWRPCNCRPGSPGQQESTCDGNRAAASLGRRQRRQAATAHLMLAGSPTGLRTNFERLATCSLLKVRLSLHWRVRVGTGCTATAGSSTPAGGVGLPTTSHKGGMLADLPPGRAQRLIKPACSSPPGGGAVLLPPIARSSGAPCNPPGPAYRVQSRKRPEANQGRQCSTDKLKRKTAAADPGQPCWHRRMPSHLSLMHITYHKHTGAEGIDSNTGS